MMRKILLLVGLIGLGACATPRETCIQNASSEQTGLLRAIGVAEGNIARGYAVHKSTVRYSYTGVCTNAEGAPFPCPQTGHRVEETPVAIDVTQEQRKLTEFRKRLDAVRAGTEAAIAQCRIIHPE